MGWGSIGGIIRCSRRWRMGLLLWLMGTFSSPPMVFLLAAFCWLHWFGELGFVCGRPLGEWNWKG